MDTIKNSQKSLYVLVGTPASGKSTWVQKQTGGKWVSRDKVRFSLITPDQEYFANENKVFRTFVNEIKEGLEKDGKVFADATHLNETSRAKLLRSLDLTDVKLIAVDFKTALDVCIERNSHREGRAFVPVSAIRRMFNQHTSPTLDTQFKFDEVIEVDENGEVICIR